MTARPTGHVHRRGPDTWQISAEHGRRTDGSRRVVYETYHGTERGARIRAAELAREMGRDVSLGDSITLRDYWDLCFPETVSNRGTKRAPSTMAYYKQQMDSHILPALGDWRLCDLTHEAIAACIRSASAPVNCKRTLSAVLRCAYDAGLMATKPLDRRVPVEKKHREKAAPWAPYEVRKALQEIPAHDPILGAYLVLGLSGLREEEALGCSWADVAEVPTYDWDTGKELRIMAVRVHVTYTDKNGLRDATKNAQSARTVPVAVAGRGIMRALMGQPHRPDERIVPLTNSGLSKRWLACLEECGLRRITPDMLRHTSDTLALVSGVGADLNDKMHGRSEHSTTYENYFRPDLASMEGAAQRLGKILGESVAQDGPQGAAPMRHHAL